MCFSVFSFAGAKVWRNVRCAKMCQNVLKCAKINFYFCPKKEGYFCIVSFLFRGSCVGDSVFSLGEKSSLLLVNELFHTRSRLVFTALHYEAPQYIGHRLVCGTKGEARLLQKPYGCSHWPFA